MLLRISRDQSTDLFFSWASNYKNYRWISSQMPFKKDELGNWSIAYRHSNKVCMMIAVFSRTVLFNYTSKEYLTILSPKTVIVQYHGKFRF